MNARNCLILTPGDIYMRTKLSLIYHKLNQEEKAIELIDAIIKNKPKLDEAYFTKALIIKNSDPMKTIELLKTAIKLDSDEPRYHAEHGDMLETMGDNTNAKIEWKKALDYDYTNSALRTKLETK
jgi:tetratricopeptide (TPR) repeat protein